MRRPNVEMFASLAARLPAGDPTRQQFEDLAGYVQHLEAQNANLRVQLTGHQVGLDAVQRDVQLLEHRVKAAEQRAADAEQRAEEAERDRVDDQHQAGACAQGRHQLEAVPRPAKLQAVPRTA